MRALAGRALLSILLCGWLCVLGGPDADAEPRVALVVGNSDYGGDLGHLPNPVNDAKLMLREGDRQQAEGMLRQSSEIKVPDLLACAAARTLLVKMQQK